MEKAETSSENYYRIEKAFEEAANRE